MPNTPMASANPISNQAAILARATYLKRRAADWVSFQKLRTSATNGVTDYLLAVALYHHGEFRAALDLLQPEARPLNIGAQSMRGYFLAELPDGPHLAWNEFQRLWQRNPSTWDTLSIQTILRLLGRKQEAEANCRKARERVSSLPPWRNDWYRQFLDYNCGELSEGGLLKAAGASRISLCEAHFFIGLTKLAEDDRADALAHFRAALATRVFGTFDYDWSGAFLARMEKDPSWPPWIPFKSEPSK